MKVLFLHRGQDVPSARIRILALVPYLEELGVECRVAPHPENAVALRKLLRRSGNPDAFVLQKKLPTLADAWAWRGCGAPLIFDYDDAVMFRQRPRDGSYESGTRRRRFARALGMADAFVCGNAYLASFASRGRGAAKPLLVAASPVALDLERSAQRTPGAPVRIGWLGSPENLPSLAALAPALRRLAEVRSFRLIVVSAQRPALEDVPVEHVPWTLAAQDREIAAFDVGLMPLEDSAWSRGKCAYKLLQYMAAGVPVVASPVGMNTEVVADGENGLLAGSADEWQRALQRLIDDPGLAERLGRAGRETIEARYGYPAIAAEWKTFLESVCGT